MGQEFSAVSLFAGCGGSDLGLAAAGIETVWANEIDEFACTLYERVTGAPVIEHADVREISLFPQAEILCGCYPCQGYSQGGKRKSDSKVNYLYREFDRALRQIQPLAFIVENVDGIRFSQNEPLLRAQVTRFRLAGYSVSWQILDAKDFGLAQDRRRLFIVGLRSDIRTRFAFPKPTHGTADNAHSTMRQVIWKYRNSSRSSYNDEPFHWYYLSRNRRRGWNEQSRCIVAHWKHVPLHPDSPPLVRIHTDKWVFSEEGTARRLNYLECAALQGFKRPGDFRVGRLRSRFRVIGNAVPPPLFAAVAKQLVGTLEASM